MTERIQNGYEPRFDVDMVFGHQAELWTGRLVDYLKAGRIEVKHKRRLDSSFYVEYSCLRGGLWQPSGISTTEAAIWLFMIADTGVAVVVEATRLRSVVKHIFKVRPRSRVRETDGSHPTLGVLVRLSDLLGGR